MYHSTGWQLDNANFTLDNTNTDSKYAEELTLLLSTLVQSQADDYLIEKGRTENTPRWLLGEKCGKNKKIDLFREDAGALDQHVACAVAAKIASYLDFYLVH